MNDGLGVVGCVGFVCCWWIIEVMCFVFVVYGVDWWLFVVGCWIGWLYCWFWMLCVFMCFVVVLLVVGIGLVCFEDCVEDVWLMWVVYFRWCWCWCCSDVGLWGCFCCWFWLVLVVSVWWWFCLWDVFGISLWLFWVFLCSVDWVDGVGGLCCVELCWCLKGEGVMCSYGLDLVVRMGGLVWIG